MAPKAGSSWNWGKSVHFQSDGRIKLHASNSGMWYENGSSDWFMGLNGRNFGIYCRGYKVTFLQNGNVGIGTANPSAKLTVAGNIRAREVRVTANAGADFVFEDDYALRPLGELEQFVQENKHLPEIAPAAQMVEEGVKTGEFQIQLLQKVEELTLYIIAQEKRIVALEAENQQLSDQ